MTGLQKDLVQLLSEAQVYHLPEDLLAYSCDGTYYITRRVPDAAVLPTSTEDVSKVLKYAFKHEIPITPRGAGSGLSGGCTPVKGGIVMDMKRMNHIVEVDGENLTARVEAGVVLRNFTNALGKRGFFYPPDPQSASVCTLGGNIATRAGGPRGVKYGTTGNYVLGVEVVLPDGAVIKNGGKIFKQSVGYDITHLMTGSEGTLGVITQADFRLLTLPPVHNLLIMSCETLELAAQTVSTIIASGTTPAMLEYAAKVAVQAMNTMVPEPLSLDYEAFLLVDVDGTQAQVDNDTKRIQEICKEMRVAVRVVDNPVQAAAYWNARSRLAPLMLSMVKRMLIEDVTVPRNRFPEFIRGVQAVAAETGTSVAVAGHSGDGNVHPSILLNSTDEASQRLAKETIDKIIRIGLELNGTISGEHGIGLHKSEYLSWDIGEEQLQLLKRIKQAFDPKGIMNPGKIWVEGAN